MRHGGSVNGIPTVIDTANYPGLRVAVRRVERHLTEALAHVNGSPYRYGKVAALESVLDELRQVSALAKPRTPSTGSEPGR